MSVKITPVPSVCTAYQLYDFQFNGRYGTAESYSKQRTEILTHLRTARQHLKATVFAFLTAEQSQSAEQLQEIGFVLASEHHNYKYPTTSKVLQLWVLEVHNWNNPENAQETVAATFTPPAPMPVRPAPVPAPPVVLNPHVGPAPGWTYITVYQDGVLRHPPEVLFGTRVGGKFRDTNGRFCRDPFPLDVWVDIPREVMRVPSMLVGTYCAVQLPRRSMASSVEYGRNWIWDLPSDNQGRIIRVKRTAPY